MSAKLEGKRSLRELLDKLVAAQKEDIYAYSSGHLNESKLFHPPAFSASPRPSTWSSSRRRALTRQRTFSPECTDATKMQNALASFALGFGGSVTPLKPSEAGEMPRKLQSLRPSSETSERVLEVLPSERGGHGISARVDRMRVGPRHLESITKAEEFQKMKDFEEDVLQKRSVLRGNLCSGKEMVDQLTNQLDKELDRLNSLGFGFGFHQLEAHSRAFDQLTSSSETFGGILGKIKRAYDDYLSHLLDGQVTKHRVLQDQLSQLTDMHSANAAAIRKEAETLEELEQRAIDSLEENKRLRASLRRETELASLPEPEIPRPTTVVRPDHLEPSERIEQLNGAICSVLEATKQLRSTIRHECVPTTVCTYLRHCIKENDVEIQRMTSQKEYYERSISELTGDLREAIETADTTERDAKKIWKKLESKPRKSQAYLGTGFWGSAGGGIESQKNDPGSDQEDDSDKWNWYIS